MIQEVLTMEQLNRVQIEIAHSFYTITTSEDEAYVAKLGEEIHNAVNKLMAVSYTHLRYLDYRCLYYT